MWLQTVGFLEAVPLWRGKGAANQEAPANIQGDIIYMNRDKIIPQNSPIGVAVTDSSGFISPLYCLQIGMGFIL